MQTVDLEFLLAIIFSLSIPIVAILGGFIVAIKRKSRETELRMALIEHQLDAESIKLLIEEPTKKNDRFSMLRCGCMLLGAGLGSLCNAAIGLSGKHDIYFWFVIAAGIGIGMLVSFAIEMRMQKPSAHAEK